MLIFFHYVWTSLKQMIWAVVKNLRKNYSSALCNDHELIAMFVLLGI